ncbi:MAG: NUDIX hydrolase N-terminal domain-containing protein [Bacilli bacterium]|nr:NUDIX hydrolase N-terminal domain-containing protein [Bacilli bacterium]
MDSKNIYDYIIKIQSIAKIGLVYSKDPYAITNYEEINELSRKFLEEFMEVNLERPNYFEKHIYPTPNISVRVVILNEDKTKILMVREAKTQTYSIPGGWCDLYDSPSTAARNECLQEAGATIKDLRLIGITDRTPLRSEVSIPNYVISFYAKIDKLSSEHEYETDDVNWFDINDLPPLSRKSEKGELLRFIKAAINGETIFD